VIKSIIASAALFLFSGLAHAVSMSSSAYTIQTSVISAAGGISSDSGSFLLQSVIAQPTPLGDVVNSSYWVLPGYLSRGASADTDGDGIPDINDAFIYDPAASVDTDGDGHPDSWNVGATQAQITASNLTLDQFPTDRRHGLDSDYDGLPDEWEMLYLGTLSGNSSMDSDGDGIANIDELNAGSDPGAMENRRIEAQRRLPPMVETLTMPETMVANTKYNIGVRVLGYDNGYDLVMAMFDCTGIINGSCGGNYGDANRFYSVTLSAPSITPAPWSYAGEVASLYSFTDTAFTVPALNTAGTAWSSAGTPIVVRFYQVSSLERAAGKASVSLLIPGGVTATYYDSTGRRIQKFIVP